TKILGAVNVPGRHMRQNVMNAALVLYLMGVQPDAIQKILGGWNGIPHRLQFFHQFKSAAARTVRFYNDSCSTVPEAAAAASAAFGKTVIFIAGGTDKGLDFEPLAEALDPTIVSSSPAAALYLLAGSGTDKLLPLLQARKIAFNGPYNSLDELLGALKKDFGDASSPAYNNDTVVFSPGCTSFGMFSNEFDRGEKFMAAVKKIFA
ncbi:MAG: UDP-N-acetylmuramoyl-L-alanine--D-glutamate ligase, partial [Treponema sp.]|nr:UDP-N-acetylmuramoyl-L-alanine--D-glutamate ligase [Treponema sp.]